MYANAAITETPWRDESDFPADSPYLTVDAAYHGDGGQWWDDDQTSWNPDSWDTTDDAWTDHDWSGQDWSGDGTDTDAAYAAAGDGNPLDDLDEVEDELVAEELDVLEEFDCAYYTEFEKVEDGANTELPHEYWADEAAEYVQDLCAAHVAFRRKGKSKGERRAGKSGFQIKKVWFSLRIER